MSRRHVHLAEKTILYLVALRGKSALRLRQDFAPIDTARFAVFYLYAKKKTDCDPNGWQSVLLCFG
jgi:hypothetical protein